MNQTLGQQDFLGMIDGIIPQLNEAKDPSEVLIKYASDNNLSEEALAHLGKTYNVLKTYSHFGHAKNASDRGKSFKVIDTDDMVKKYATYKVIPTESAPVFMSTPLEEKKQEKKASVCDGYEISERLDNGKHYMSTVNETPINYDTVKVASKKEASEVDRIFQKNEEEANMRFFIGAKKMENEMIASKIASKIKEMSQDEWNSNVWNEFCKVANNHYSDEINVALDYIEGFLDKNLVRFNKQAFVRDSDPDLIHPKYNDMFTGVFEIIDNMQMLKAAANDGFGTSFAEALYEAENEDSDEGDIDEEKVKKHKGNADMPDKFIPKSKSESKNVNRRVVVKPTEGKVVTETVETAETPKEETKETKQEEKKSETKDDTVKTTTTTTTVETTPKKETKEDKAKKLTDKAYAKALTSMGGGLSSGAQTILSKLENAYSTLANKLDAQYAATSQAYANALANKDEFKQKMMNPYVKDDFKAMLDHNVNMLYRTDPIISKQPWTQVKDSVDSILRQAPSITQDRQALKQLLRSQLSLEGGVDLGSVKTMRQIEA
mgnify:CR=1 FL=1